MGCASVQGDNTRTPPDFSRGTKVKKNANPCTRKVYSWILYGCKVHSMVYLEPLYSRLDRLAYRQSIQISTEAQQEHVKILFFKMLNIFIKKVKD